MFVSIITMMNDWAALSPLPRRLSGQQLQPRSSSWCARRRSTRTDGRMRRAAHIRRWYLLKATGACRSALRTKTTNEVLIDSALRRRKSAYVRCRENSYVVVKGRLWATTCCLFCLTTYLTKLRQRINDTLICLSSATVSDWNCLPACRENFRSEFPSVLLKR